MIFMRDFDGAAFGMGVVLVLFAGLVAVYLPSCRAIHIDPIQLILSRHFVMTESETQVPIRACFS